MTITAKSRFVRTAPDKIRILEDLIKGKSIEKAITNLEFSSKYAAKPLILVLKQMTSQIKSKDESVDGFIIKSLQVDEGPKLKRRRIRHQGKATAILKRLSHVKVTATDSKIGDKADKMAKSVESVVKAPKGSK